MHLSIWDRSLDVFTIKINLWKIKMPHKITLKEISHYTVRTQLAGSFGTEENKSLYMYTYLPSLDIKFRVYNYRNVICKTEDLNEAVEAYNNV